MLDGDNWVCGSCRSVNTRGADRCYACRSPRSLSIDPRTAPVTGLPASVRDESTTPEERRAIATRAGAAWAPTDRLAWAARVAVVAVSVVSLAKIAIDIQSLAGAQGTAVDEAQLGVGLVPSLATIVMVLAWLAGLVAWGAWLRAVVANVPALGGGFPGTGPDAAFLSAVVPGANLVWSTAVLRDVIVRLSPRDGARLGLLTGWWIAMAVALLPWIGRIPGQPAAIRTFLRLVAASLTGLATGVTGSQAGAIELGEAFGGVLLLIAAALAIWLIDRVEDLQEERRKELGVGVPA